ncbi:hypothetical protein [Flavobacterium ardleyense]|uniref:hypothetical protein n=1 Tax=Flavobacterium ardleyense TaxID=2038737 RepID=UPI00298C4DF8|nr:hypothetical protein [Flavobacterium ardleyense]
MGVVIKQIQLKNWFGYKGEYEDNTFEFSDGVNIVVATNDIGKSKLHNAFRWIFEDKVILKNTESNKHEIISINMNNICEVLNHFIQTSLKNDEKTTLGVKLTYEIKNLRGDSKVRILTKEILCGKEVNTIKVAETKFKVERLERGNLKTAMENFSDCVKELMRNNLKDYFLVQGENVENLTPLKGNKLVDTINNLVELDILDKKYNTSDLLSKSIKKLKNDIETKDNRDNVVAKNNIKKKQSLEKEIEILEEIELIEIEEFIIENEKTIHIFSSQANEAKERKKLKEEIDKFNKDIYYKEGNLKALYKSFVESCINGNFWISKLTGNTLEKEILDQTSIEVREYVANRRAELDDRLTGKEQQMLSALERDQPSPLILDQMVVEGQCYVCSQKLNDEGRIYIKEKLIPYFKKELNHDDIELKVLEDVHDFVKKSQGYLNKFSPIDLDFITQQKNEIISIGKEIKEIEICRERFVESNGTLEENDDDNITLSTYNDALIKAEKLKEERECKISELNTKKLELSNVKINNEKEKVSKEFIIAEDLQRFSELLSNYLLKLKNEEYLAFCIKLENVANKKWKAFTNSNAVLNNQNIKVEFSINSAKKPEFEIRVVDKYGNNSDQGGGASQAIRQLSVIFGLVEIAKGNVDYPFIADAPTSHTTLALTEEFFNYQLDHAQNQNILITKELWDDRSDDLNSTGHSILNKVQNINNARFITIKNGEKKNRLITLIK